ncbi:hypothetical protein C8R43DRAFT_1243691 [Mycena crocata]|nr:hypothetical protein C8R43DRAFT_1243691 [Mycena crocata]
MAKREKRSSLPPTLIPLLYDRPQQPQVSSPSSSHGSHEEVERPASPFEPSRAPGYPLRPLVPPTHPAPYPETRRQYSGYESGAHDAASLLPSTRLPSSEQSGGPSSIPHGSVRRYRSPVVSDPIYISPGRQQGPGYSGSHSLPLPLHQSSAPPGHWGEGEAGPSSLTHSHPYPSLSRQISPSYRPPQPIHRRATEPGGYSSDPAHVQQPALPLHGGYDRHRFHEQQHSVGYPSRPPSEIPYAEGSQSRGPPLPFPTGAFTFTQPRRQGDHGDLLSIHRLHSQSSLASDYTRVDDGSYLGPHGLRRRADDDFDENPRRSKIAKKIQVACRKLRCDGLKPICGNCNQRDQHCTYKPYPKRRGPGKAAKGSRVKKRVSKGRRSESSSSQAAPGSADDTNWDGQTLAPSLRTQGSIDSGLSMYSHTLAESSQSLVGGRYLAAPPERTPPQRRPSRSRNRAPSSEYYTPPPDDDETER